MPIMKSMFQRRHYDFLVNWGATNLKPTQMASLADALATDNPRFDRKRFLKTYVELRRFARAHEATIEAQLRNGPPRASPEAIEAAEDLLGPKHGLAHPTPQALAPASRSPAVDMGAYLRKHAEANAGRGMWEYTRCWKCDSGRRPDVCPVGCKGACEYPSAVND